MFHVQWTENIKRWFFICNLNLLSNTFARQFSWRKALNGEKIFIVNWLTVWKGTIIMITWWYKASIFYPQTFNHNQCQLNHETGIPISRIFFIRIDRKQGWMRNVSLPSLYNKHSYSGFMMKIDSQWTKELQGLLQNFNIFALSFILNVYFDGMEKVQ